MRPESLLRHCALLLIATVLGTSAAVASPRWNTLNSQQQALIKPALQSQGGNFDALSEQRRETLVKGADRWLAMSPQQRTTATQQFQQWQLMSVDQKMAVLERRDRFRKMSPEQRKALLETQKQFLERPLQQQAELQDQFNDLQPSVDGLTSQPFGPSPSTPPSTTSPLGLPPVTGLPGNSSGAGAGGTINIPLLPH